MAGRRFATFGGLAAVGGATYYLYSAGGDAKLAEKKFEHDAANATRRVRGDFPGQDKEAKKAGEEGYEAVRATAQDYANRASAEAKKAEADLRAYTQQAQNKAQAYSAEAQNKAQEYSAEAQAKYNKMSVEAKKKWDEARAQGQEFTRETSKDFNAAVDRFDREVTKDAAQAKSWLGSWFGGK
ncbi:hypothetical protein N0V87_004321 [Didymella glomerata]|uniref:Uncharacterized protein n=1 Tax=Didymella glomerata TaxID=749621 RepID=A0A9W8X239_9PLEO|nr:hypothetical protein N0V87_004321 [Didymella glomerata]